MRLVCDICSHTLRKVGSSGRGIHYHCEFCKRNLQVRILSGSLVYKVTSGRGSNTKESVDKDHAV